MSLITCENLTLGYEGKAILSGLNFSVNSGDYLCIVGENGSGKSTLMKTLLHLQSPMSGSISGRRFKNQRDWLSATADCASERLPCFGRRNCDVWFPGKNGASSFLQ